MAFWRKIRVMFQASGMIYETIHEETQNLVFSERISPVVKEFISWMRGFCKVQQFKSNTGLLEMNLLQNTTFTSSKWWGHEEVSSTLKRRYILKDLHSVLKLCWSGTNADMLPLIISLQSHPSNLGKFSRTVAETASQKHSSSKKTISAGSRVWWQAQSPRTSLWKQLMGTIKIKLTIPVIVPSSTLHWSTTAF